MKLSPLQQLVAKHYAGGEFSHFADIHQLYACGDTLFVFVMLEAADAKSRNTQDTFKQFDNMLEQAIRELRSLQAELLEHT